LQALSFKHYANIKVKSITRVVATHENDLVKSEEDKSNWSQDRRD